MSAITRPLILDETGQRIAAAMETIARAKNSSVPNDQVSEVKYGVQFIDYDGTLLYTYTTGEALALTSLPPNPTHEGLTSQGWNWTLQEITNYIDNYPECLITVGQMYVTSDGKTRIHIQTHGRLGVPLFLTTNATGYITIDWGDNTIPETLEVGERVETGHTYESDGEYVITIFAEDGCTYVFGGEIEESSLTTIVNMFGPYKSYSDYITEIYLGNDIPAITDGAFNCFYALTKITIPQSVEYIEHDAFSGCCSLAAVTIPVNVTCINAACFYGCTSLKYIAISPSVTAINSYAFCICSSLRSLIIPEGVTEINEVMCSLCYLLNSVILPDGVEHIEGGAFEECTSLKYVDLPNTITELTDYAFNLCSSLMDITILATVPPTITSHTFADLPEDCTIHVPYGSGNTYKAATNWSQYANQIIELGSPETPR